jgi:hypothetical protein
VQAESPILASMTHVTIRVNGGPATTLPTPSDGPVMLQPGAIHTYKFTWSHLSIRQGSVLTIQACFVATGNTAANSCMVLTQTT